MLQCIREQLHEFPDEVYVEFRFTLCIAKNLSGYYFNAAENYAMQKINAIY